MRLSEEESLEKIIRSAARVVFDHPDWKKQDSPNNRAQGLGRLATVFAEATQRAFPESAKAIWFTVANAAADAIKAMASQDPYQDKLQLASAMIGAAAGDPEELLDKRRQIIAGVTDFLNAPTAERAQKPSQIVQRGEDPWLDGAINAGKAESDLGKNLEFEAYCRSQRSFGVLLTIERLPEPEEPMRPEAAKRWFFRETLALLIDGVAQEPEQARKMALAIEAITAPNPRLNETDSEQDSGFEDLSLKEACQEALARLGPVLIAAERGEFWLKINEELGATKAADLALSSRRLSSQRDQEGPLDKVMDILASGDCPGNPETVVAAMTQLGRSRRIFLAMRESEELAQTLAQSAPARRKAMRM